MRKVRFLVSVADDSDLGGRVEQGDSPVAADGRVRREPGLQPRGVDRNPHREYRALWSGLCAGS